jgi:hypothetical protein
LRQHQQINNGDYRRLNRVDPTTAGGELRGPTETDLVEQEEVGRWTSSCLKVSPESPEQREPQTDQDRIMARVREGGAVTSAGCRELLSVDENRTYYLLKALCDQGRLVPMGQQRCSSPMPARAQKPNACARNCSPPPNPCESLMYPTTHILSQEAPSRFKLTKPPVSLEMPHVGKNICPVG